LGEAHLHERKLELIIGDRDTVRGSRMTRLMGALAFGTLAFMLAVVTAIVHVKEQVRKNKQQFEEIKEV